MNKSFRWLFFHDNTLYQKAAGAEKYSSLIMNFFIINNGKCILYNLEFLQYSAIISVFLTT
jgi:hypothetical protein